MIRLSDLLNKSLEVYYPKEIQNDEDDGDHDQSMNPTARFRERWAVIRTENADKPQDDSNNDDCLQHEISPVE